MSRDFTHSDSEASQTFDAESDEDRPTPIELLFGSRSASPPSADPVLESAERETLEAADVDPAAVEQRRVSYRMLQDAGVAESLAGTLRRRFSLPWSFETDGDLDRRASAVRGLGAAEREWVARSNDDSWQSFEYDHEPADERDPPTDRPVPKPTPITAVTGVGPDDADRLAEAGVRSAERLATIDAFAIARALDLDVLHVRSWRHNARELLD